MLEKSVDVALHNCVNLDRNLAVNIISEWPAYIAEILPEVEEIEGS